MVARKEDRLKSQKSPSSGIDLACPLHIGLWLFEKTPRAKVLISDLTTSNNGNAKCNQAILAASTKGNLQQKVKQKLGDLREPLLGPRMVAPKHKKLRRNISAQVTQTG